MLNTDSLNKIVVFLNLLLLKGICLRLYCPQRNISVTMELIAKKCSTDVPQRMKRIDFRDPSTVTIVDNVVF